MKKYWNWAFLVAVSAVRIGIGIMQSISGPTLTVLSNHVCESPTKVGWIFTARSVGFILGTLLPEAAERLGIDQMLPLTISVGAMAVVCGVMPVITAFWLLILVVTLSGIINGYVDAAIQCIMLKVWGATKSASILQLHHFTFSVGAFIAPLLVLPFYSQDGSDDVCSTNDDEEFQCKGISDTNEILIPYEITTAFIVLVFAGMLYLYCKDVTAKIQESNVDDTDDRPEDTFATLALYFIPLTVYYFCIVGGETMYQSNIFSYALCGVKLSESAASLLNSLFWAGFGIGRGSGIFITRFISPTLYITLDCIGITACSILLSVMTDEYTLWICTFFYGLSIASFYSCGVTFTHILTNVSGKWIVVFGIGNAIGAMSLPLIGTQLAFSSNHITFMYLLLGISLLNICAFALMYLFGYYVGPLPKTIQKRAVEQYNTTKERLSREISTL